MQQSYLILTDSGGIQEEAPALGKPVLLMRDTTERPEAIHSGAIKLIGTSEDKIVTEVQQLFQDKSAYHRMSCTQHLYGDGKASQRIVNKITEFTAINAAIAAL
jgi:UDP-N-acetylglucosamine 2-epimerase (non-hydrolysing)